MEVIGILLLSVLSVLSFANPSASAFTFSRGELPPAFSAATQFSAAELPPQFRSAARKKVRFYSAKWCGPCQAVSAQLSAASLPFDVEKIDVDQSGWPNGVSAIPHIEWESQTGKRLYLEKWVGAADLIKRWEFSQSPASSLRSVAPAANPLNHNYQQWGVRGMTMEYHLRVDHGIDTRGLTAWELQKAHDAVHAGISSATINAYIRAHKAR